MQTSILKADSWTVSWTVDAAVRKKLLWLMLVLLTMGLSLLTPKRLLTVELRKELLATQPDVVLATEVPQSISAPKKIVMKVMQVKHLPVWASAIAEVDLIHEEYPQVGTNTKV